MLANCTHYWMIEPPSGPSSLGVCQNCGETRDFVNYVPTLGWEEVRDVTSPHLEARREKGQYRIANEDKWIKKREARKARHEAIIAAYKRVEAETHGTSDRGIQKIREETIAAELGVSRSTVRTVLKSADLITIGARHVQVRQNAVERHKAILEMFARTPGKSDGARYQHVAEMFGVSRSTVRQVVASERYNAENEKEERCREGLDHGW